MVVPHLMTLADLSAPQISRLLRHSYALKQTSLPWLAPVLKQPPAEITNLKHKPSSGSGSSFPRYPKRPAGARLVMPSQSLFNKSIAFLFSKRSTRTRVSGETAATLLGGKAMFLGREDIQIGVNESVRDSARVIGGMCEGIFARVGEHSEIEELAKYSPVPVLNALSSLWHPMQILADLLTLHEHAHLFTSPSLPPHLFARPQSLPDLPPLTVTWLGDSTNVLHDILVSFPRLGHRVRVATPPGEAYQCPAPVWDRVRELGCEESITWTADPREAVHGADVVITDTWISMGQEAEKAQRLKDFSGYQVTEQLCKEGGAKENWKFMHCLPRKPEEVDDEVFYGERSLVFPEADNRKWTAMAVFDQLFGKWDLGEV